MRGRATAELDHVDGEDPFSLSPKQREAVKSYLSENWGATVSQVQADLGLPVETVEEIRELKRRDGGGGSRLTNSNNSVNCSDAGISDSEETRDIPTPAERVAEFQAEYPELADLKLSQADRVKLRREFVEISTEEWESEPAHEWEDPVKGKREVVDGVKTWGEAVEIALEKYEETRKTTVNLERGRPTDPEFAEFSVESETRWFPSYQKKYFGQRKGWIRELTGGERPSGGATEGSFDDPYIVLLTRSASSVPGGDRLSPVDHAKEVVEAWEPCYQTLRNTLRSKGYELGEDWQYDRQMEPHSGERGGGVNHCYPHEHPIIVIDGEVEAEDFRAVLEKHVEECEPAGMDAHRNDPCSEHDNGNGWNDAEPECEDCQTAVTVYEAEELDDIAGYVSAYTSVKPEGLLEREAEYLGFAAAMDAANLQTKSRSDAAKYAAEADACKQRAEHAETDQDHGHGERVVRSTKRGYDLECAECGSPHGIDQDQTLTAARLGDSTGEPAVCDGGHECEAKQRNDLRDQWEDARAAAKIGETPTRKKRRKAVRAELDRTPNAPAVEILGRAGLPPDCRDLVREVRAGADRSDAVGFERAPSWRVVSVTVDGQEYPASAGNGVDMVEVDLSGEWRPPHSGGRECPACDCESVLSAREARKVYHVDVDGAYWCSDCEREFAPIDGPSVPPECLPSVRQRNGG